MSLITGEVVYLFAFDVAYDMRREPLRRLLGQEVAQFSFDASKRSPPQLSFYRPQMVRLPVVERVGPHGPVRLDRSIKILPIGALSITVRVPFSVERIEDLVHYHDLRFGERTLDDEVRQLAEDARRELAPWHIRPVPHLPDEEAYTIFAITSLPVGGHLRAVRWLGEHRRAVAALLTQESDLGHLSDRAVEESTARALSYYEHDLVVVDWDAALVIDDRRGIEETIYIMELANLQLAEFEAYDKILDQSVEQSYRDMATRSLFRVRSALAPLRELRIDLARLSDELSNITKFFGDWHSARIYQVLAERFHLPDWHRSIDAKLTTLDELYQLANQDQHTRQMLILEVMIVLLFVLDLVVLVVRP